MNSWMLSPSIRLVNGGVSIEDADRQQHTADAILQKLEKQPGVILADEVGMGKTFVALAILASAAWASRKPAVVMAPPRLIQKWKRDATRFAERCVVAAAGAETPRFECRTADTGVAFLKCFDDPPERSCQLVLVANTAFHRQERDPWVRLAAMKRAFPYTERPDTMPRTVARYAHRILRSSELARLGDQDFERLLSTRIDGWRSVLSGILPGVDDDPVPTPFMHALTEGHLRDIAGALNHVPVRETETFEERITAARGEVSRALREVWKEALKRAQIQSPLLVFDEAHHLKNGDTRLARLFQDPETADTSVVSDAFDRMVFLTATPFQLGHRELVEVLRRFRAVRWDDLQGFETPESFARKLDELEQALDRAQSHALKLDSVWGRLRIEDVELSQDGELTLGAQRGIFECSDDSKPAYEVAHEFRKVRAEFTLAEGLLRPWVVRHLRSRRMRTENGDVPRRLTLKGRGIHDGQPSMRGLELAGAERFPFLLCARAQGVLAHHSGRRAYFAEGLASSFGAFVDTVTERARPSDDADVELEGSDPSGEVAWYVSEVEAIVGSRRDPASHPKVAATVRRTIEEWRNGHKVLVFGHYRKTIDDLTSALEKCLEEEETALASKALGLPADDARAAAARISKRLEEGLLRREVSEQLGQWIREFENLEVHSESIVALLLRTLGESSFVVRHFPLDREEVRRSLEADRLTAPQARDVASAVVESLRRRRGKTAPSFQSRVRSFLRYLAEDLSSAEERNELLVTLDQGPRLGAVEKAYGLVDPRARHRRLVGFNSPLLPEILVASEVMAEGLDLHLDCRHVIHHDLSWNPSTLEQRTGRVDRLRCRAEIDGESIHVFLPYLEGTADEKMYRVVSDRARWFQVVMGERYQVDEASTEALARRVPFPESAAAELMFELGVIESRS